MGCLKVLQRIIGLALVGALLSGCCSMDAARGYVLPRLAMEYARRHPTPTRVRVRRTPTRAPVAAGSTPTKPAPVVTPASLYVPEGWKLYEKPEDGFAIALPPAWERVDVNAKTIDALIEEGRTPGVTEARKDQILATVKFWAFASESASVTSADLTNVYIIKQRLPRKVSLDAYAQLVVAQAENDKDVDGPVTHQRIHLPAGEAEELRVRETANLGNGQTQAIEELVYLFIRDQDLLLIGAETSPEQFDEYLPTFESIARSFRYLD